MPATSRSTTAPGSIRPAAKSCGSRLLAQPDSARVVASIASTGSRDAADIGLIHGVPTARGEQEPLRQSPLRPIPSLITAALAYPNAETASLLRDYIEMDHPRCAPAGVACQDGFMPLSNFAPAAGSADWQALEAALTARGVPPTLRTELRGRLAGRYDGLLLYGSWARGDAGVDSDLDVLALNYLGTFPREEGRVSLARYTSSELSDMSGTLFGFHLTRDGVILRDRNAQLSRILRTIQSPEPGSVISRIRSLTPVLDVSSEDRSRYIEGLTRVARYLLRSALYAEAIDQGEPSFSVREIAQRKDDPDLVGVLSSHVGVHPPASDAVFEDLRLRLAALIGPLNSNPYGGLHELIEGAWRSDRDLSSFATLALSDDGREHLYEELPKVTL